jgi:hypothetical protein
MARANNKEGDGVGFVPVTEQGNYPEENIQHTEHGESLKSLMFLSLLEDLSIIIIRRSKPTRYSINMFVFHVVFL